MEQFTSNFFYLLIRVFGRHFISGIFTVVASVFDDMAKMAGDRSTGWTNHFLWDIFPFIKESDLQSIGILVGLPTSPALKDGSHLEVHRLEIRAWGGPHWLVTKRWKHQFAKVLDKNHYVLVHHPAWMYKAGSHKCFGAMGQLGLQACLCRLIYWSWPQFRQRLRGVFDHHPSHPPIFPFLWRVMMVFRICYGLPCSKSTKTG